MRGDIGLLKYEVVLMRQSMEDYESRTPVLHGDVSLTPVISDVWSYERCWEP